ncbi:UNVERIFIED_CONTAM: hypothetical protein GTU68_009017 [Idotea baltica]|nr:hypothetical protein [Idotea baltica]
MLAGPNSTRSLRSSRLRRATSRLQGTPTPMARPAST